MRVTDFGGERQVFWSHGFAGGMAVSGLEVSGFCVVDGSRMERDW